MAKNSVQLKPGRNRFPSATHSGRPGAISLEPDHVRVPD